MRNFWVSLITTLVLLLTILFQVNVLNVIQLFGVTANVGIVFVVALGILCGQKIGITIGIIYGAFMDILFGKSFGIYTLLYTIIGFVCGKISHGFSKENKSAIVMISAITTLAFELICYVIFVIIYDYDFMIFSTVHKIILECVYNIFIAKVLFKPYSALAEIINKGKSSYYLL